MNTEGSRSWFQSNRKDKTVKRKDKTVKRKDKTVKRNCVRIKLSCRQVSFCHVKETPSHHQSRDAENMLCSSHGGVHSFIQNSKRKLADQTIYPHGFIDPNFDPARFSLDSTFNLLAFHGKQPDVSFYAFT
jgi:hypothetical protein